MKHVVLLLCCSLVACRHDQDASATQEVGAATDTATTLVSGREARVDTTFVRESPLNLEGELATVTYHLWAPSWDDPVAWKINVVAGSDTLYQRSGSSADLESAFDEDIVPHCDGYLACKRRWYLELFPDFYVDTLEVGTERRGMIEDEFFIPQARAHFEGMGYTDSDAAQLAVELKRYYAGRSMIVFAFPEDPIVGGPLWTYDPTLRQLVPVYEG